MLDRVDLSDCSDVPPTRPTQWTMDDSERVANKVLPSVRDEASLNDHFGYLVARVMVQRIPFFQQLEHKLPKFTSHPYSKQMSQKSECVS